MKKLVKAVSIISFLLIFVSITANATELLSSLTKLNKDDEMTVFIKHKKFQSEELETKGIAWKF